MKKIIVSTVLLICFSYVANAQEIEDIKKCSLINDPMKRLACFDNLVKGDSESPKDEVKPVVAKVEPKETDLVIEEGVSKSSEEVIEGQQEKIVSLERRIKRITRQRDVEKQKNERISPGTILMVSPFFSPALLTESVSCQVSPLSSLNLNL